MKTMEEKVKWRLEFLIGYRKTLKGNNNYTRQTDAQIELLKELLEDE